VQVKLRWIALAAVSLVVATAFVACGDDDDDDGGDGGGTTPAATAPSGSTPSSGGGVTENIAFEAEDFSFSTETTSVPPGATINVDFTNNGSAPHTLTFYEDDAYTSPISGADSGQVSGGESTSFSFTSLASGELYYRCEVHPSQMQGELAIE
jgi:plastocyanin